jgi:hypothetical protein
MLVYFQDKADLPGEACNVPRIRLLSYDEKVPLTQYFCQNYYRHLFYNKHPLTMHLFYNKHPLTMHLFYNKHPLTMYPNTQCGKMCDKYSGRFEKDTSLIFTKKF